MGRIVPPRTRYFIPALLIRVLLYLLSLLLYSIRPVGRENIPRDGGVLLVSNHISYADTVLVQFACPRLIHYVAMEELFRVWWLGWLLRMMGVVPISSRDPRQAFKHVVQKLKEGEVVCVFPEGKLTRTGQLLKLKRGFEVIANRGNCPVLPVIIDGIWGSQLSYAGNRFFGKKPLPLRHSVRVAIGKPIPPQADMAPKVREALLELHAHTFAQRPRLEGNLTFEALRALTTAPWKRQVIDTFPQRRELSRGKLLAASIAISREWKKQFPEERIGVALPPGAGGIVANLGLMLAGKIPVNINFTAGKAATQSSYELAGLKTVITAKALQDKIGDFVWPENVVDLPEQLKALSKAKIAGWLLLAWLLPGALLAPILGVPRKGSDKEAGLLFTSGSSGRPKGVVLTHKNILANISQVSDVNLLQPGDSLLASLPLFHSFGYTVTFWYPILNRIPIVSVPSPLDIARVANAVKNEGVTAVLGTPGFLRPYVKKIDTEDFASVRLLVSGAEKLPSDLRKALEEKFRVPVLEGYGLTETSPVVSANLPDPVLSPGNEEQPGARAGSVGRLFPGMAAKIMSEDGAAKRSLFESGVLHLKGANVFGGYLNEPEKTDEAFQEGWYVTGDVARFDEDGFLFIEGRISRFSKIGGEMVPHGAVEEKICEILDLSGDNTEVVVMSVRDNEERENLVVLTSLEIEPSELRRKLKDAGIPNLWIPRHMFRVDEIPLLGTGKLDLKNCQELAEQKWREANAT